MTSSLLFVYGTLRRRSRHPMAHFLESRACFLGEAKVQGQLFDLGRYPGAVPSTDPGDWLFGDLYELGGYPETMADLDRYENGESPHPAFFERHEVAVILLPDQPRTAWIYWFRGAMPGAVRIASGVYDKNFRPPETL